jgi:transcriptional regulator with XRE-family HTH domain
MKRKTNTPYLRALRLRSAFTQDEVAFLLGTFDRTHVSRHESGKCVPILADYHAYALIFGTSVAAAFESEHAEITKEVRKRARSLHESLAHRTSDPLRGQKRAALEKIIRRCSTNQST